MKYYYNSFYIIIVSRFFQVISYTCHIDTVVNLMLLILAHIDIIEFKITVVKSGRAYYDNLVIISAVSHWPSPLTCHLQQPDIHNPHPSVILKILLPGVLKAETSIMCPFPRSAQIGACYHS